MHEISHPVATTPGSRQAGATAAPGASAPIIPPAPGASLSAIADPPLETHQINVGVGGRVTCVSLEWRFWRHLHRMAAERDVHLNALIGEVAAARPRGTMLSRALRLMVITDLEARVFPKP